MHSTVFNLASGCETIRGNDIMASIPFYFFELNVGLETGVPWSSVKVQGSVALSQSGGVIVIDA